MDLHIYDTNHIGNKNKNSIHINWNGEKINKLLEKDRNKIRLKYSNIIHGIIKKNSHDHKFLKIKEINLTKLSLINEKNPFKSSSIHNCLKLLLVEKLVKKKHIKKIYYHGENDEIEKSLKKFSKNLNLDYKNENFILNYSGSKIDYFLKGNIFFIKQIIKNNGLNKNSKMYSNSSIFSYFVHFNTKDRKIFNSNLWGNLNEYFNSKKKLINWFHFYVPSHQVSNSREANFMQENFNLNKFENHNFINSYLSKLELIKTYFLFCNFFFKNCFLLRPKTLFFKNKLSKSNFCFFLEKDFLSSFFGPTLIYNIMNVFIFNNMLKNIPRQKFGLYIIENQSWEYCFIKFWRKYKHGKLIAYFNSSIRFWDLRYLKKNIEYNYKAENPDIYLLNNKIFKNEAKKLGFPNNKIYIVEALRYSRLSPIRKRVNNKKIIIIGDILFEETEYLLDFINKVVSKLRKYKLFFKPHPTMTKKSITTLINKYNYLKISNVSSEKFKNFEFAICSNGTSANLDCLMQKINFCSVKTFNSLNLYPINKYQNFFQVKDPSEIIERIKKPKKIKSKAIFETTTNITKFKKFLYKLNI